MRVSQSVSSLLAGVLFGVGLALSGMLDPEIVKAFLNPFGDWNYSLALVMASAIGVTAPAYYFIFKRERPVLSDKFHISDLKHIDKKLIAGGVLFGVGWGVYGLCPGPAVAQLLSVQLEVFVFVLAMTAGMMLTEKYS